MRQHNISHLDKGGDVGTGYQIVGVSIFFSVGLGILVDVGHDILQFAVHFFKRPLQALRVLCHFESGNGYATGIGCLARRKEHLVLLEASDCLHPA